MNSLAGYLLGLWHQFRLLNHIHRKPNQLHYTLLLSACENHLALICFKLRSESILNDALSDIGHGHEHGQKIDLLIFIAIELITINASIVSSWMN